MRLLLILIVSVALSNHSFGQTNTFPSTGNVGIGTMSPSTILHVDESSARLQFTSGSNEPTLYVLRTSSSGWSNFYLSSTEVGLKVNSSGELRISAPAGGWFPTFYSNGSEAMRIHTNGNVGIGTTTPQAKLHVNGSFQISNSTYTGDFTIQHIANGQIRFVNSAIGDFMNIGPANVVDFGGQQIRSTFRGSYFSNVAGGYALQTAAGNNAFNSTSGNTLIGTITDNGNKLQVSGNISLANQTNALQISYAALSETTSGASTILGNNVKAGASNNTIKRFSNGSDAGSYISLNYYNGITFHTGIASALNTEVSSFNNEVMRITQDSKIGIGTATPSEKLDVYGNVKATGFILPTGAAAGKVLTSDASGNATWQTASTGSAGWAYDGSTVGALKKIGTTDNYALPFITNNTEWMRITTAGNVGIGTTSPSEKLAVNGNILSKKVKVTQTGWADYVFHSSYKLPSLQEVEAYIKQHHHLPEIPSAAEVQKNGLDLGDTQTALLKKIEELTLYTIDQNKRIEEQQKQIDELRNLINNQRK